MPQLEHILRKQQYKINYRWTELPYEVLEDKVN